jgi:hypothetical protein
MLEDFARDVRCACGERVEVSLDHTSEVGDKFMCPMCGGFVETDVHAPIDEPPEED